MTSRARSIAAFPALALALLPARASAEPRPTDAFLDETRAQWETLAHRVWETPELAFHETRSSHTLAEALQREGFKVTWGAGGMKTAFVATAGSGRPVIAYLVEYDALPSLSQAAGKAAKAPVAEGAPGHGCGHNLLGTASLAAAAAANRERVSRKLAGTIQVLGTPAEEVGLGKTFLIRDGAFRDTDVALAWHPDDQNRVTNRTRLALAGFEVEFFGRASHAAASPWLGRSALDALALFDHAMALMREHVKPTARIHRMIVSGGAAPNIIPDYTKGEYWLRDASIEAVDEMQARMRKAADGAALATETRAKVTVLFSDREPVPNDSLNQAMQRELERVGPPPFTPADVEFAKAMQKELGFEQKGLATTVMPFAPRNGGTASSDIGEVSAVVPLAELNVATRPIGTAAHHWAQTSCAAHPVGYKAMLVAAKVLAGTGVDLLADPSVVKAAKEDFVAQTKGKPYVSPLAADARPPQ